MIEAASQVPIRMSLGNPVPRTVLGALLFSLLISVSELSAAQDQDVIDQSVEIEFELSTDSRDADEGGEPEVEIDPQQRALEQARALEVSRELATRRQAIEDMQSELGIYNPALTEAYADLAAFYAENEDYENAILLYADALQVARINTGLYSETQLPVLERLIENNLRLDEYQEVDDLYELALHINSRLYPIHDPRYLEIANGYGAWKLDVLRENLLEQNYRGLANTAEDLSLFYDRIITTTEAQGDARQIDIVGMVYKKIQADLALARSIANTPASSFEGGASRYINQTRCQSVRTSTGELVRQCYNVQIENPQFRQAQRNAKQYAINRHSRSIINSIERLEHIQLNSEDLNGAQLQELDEQITSFRAQLEGIMRAGRRRLL